MGGGAEWNNWNRASHIELYCLPWQQQSGGGVTAQLICSTVGWTLCAAVDVDNDGVGDLLWQTPDDLVGGWFMNSNSTARTANFWWNTGAWKLKAAGR